MVAVTVRVSQFERPALFIYNSTPFQTPVDLKNTDGTSNQNWKWCGWWCWTAGFSGYV